MNRNRRDKTAAAFGPGWTFNLTDRGPRDFVFHLYVDQQKRKTRFPRPIVLGDRWLTEFARDTHPARWLARDLHKRHFQYRTRKATR